MTDALALLMLAALATAHVLALAIRALLKSDTA
jgi:hypothetical protein